MKAWLQRLFDDYIHQKMCQLGFVIIITWLYTDNMIPNVPLGEPPV